MESLESEIQSTIAAAQPRRGDLVLVMGGRCGQGDDVLPKDPVCEMRVARSLKRNAMVQSRVVVAVSGGYHSPTITPAERYADIVVAVEGNVVFLRKFRRFQVEPTPRFPRAA